MRDSACAMFVGRREGEGGAVGADLRVEELGWRGDGRELPRVVDDEEHALPFRHALECVRCLDLIHCGLGVHRLIAQLRVKRQL